MIKYWLMASKSGSMPNPSPLGRYAKGGSILIGLFSRSCSLISLPKISLGQTQEVAAAQECIYMASIIPRSISDPCQQGSSALEAILSSI